MTSLLDIIANIRSVRFFSMLPFFLKRIVIQQLGSPRSGGSRIDYGNSIAKPRSVTVESGFTQYGYTRGMVNSQMLEHCNMLKRQSSQMGGSIRESFCRMSKNRTPRGREAG